VRAGRNDRPLPHPVAIQRVDVAAGEDLEDVVVAHPAGRVAGARLLLAEDREPDTGRVEAGRERPGDAPVALVERRRAADPVEDLEAVEPPGDAASEATVGTSNGRPFVQSVRVEAGWPHGLPWPSIARNAPVSSDGKRDSSRTRLRRSPTILSTCSIRTGRPRRRRRT
jgi:hypothetical protein